MLYAYTIVHIFYLCINSALCCLHFVAFLGIMFLSTCMITINIVQLLPLFYEKYSQKDTQIPMYNIFSRVLPIHEDKAFLGRNWKLKAKHTTEDE